MSAIQTNPAADSGVSDILQRLGVAYADELLPLLESADEEIARDACVALGRVGTKAHSRALLKILWGDRTGLWMPSAVALSLLDSKRPTRQLIAILLDSTRATDQRFAAAYALGFTSAALRDPHHAGPMRVALMEVLRTPQEPAILRGLVAEGLGNLFSRCMGASDRRGLAYHAAGSLLIAGLRDPEPQVRFWSAFALGALRYRKALPALRELAGSDEGQFGNWWTVGEEASDAIDWIEGREPPERSTRIAA